MVKDSANVFVPGEHGSTYGGNPLVCAAAYATLKYIIDNNVVDNVRKVGRYFTGRLEELKNKYSFITDVRGRGLLLAIEFDREIAADALNSCLENGLLVNRVKPNALRFMPPLIIGNGEVDEAINILDKVLAAV
jgi:acetylornithine/succinyldiaminopimelate/putrescine aminotransferase